MNKQILHLEQKIRNVKKKTTNQKNCFNTESIINEHKYFLFFFFYTEQTEDFYKLKLFPVAQDW